MLLVRTLDSLHTAVEHKLKKFTKLWASQQRSPLVEHTISRATYEFQWPLSRGHLHPIQSGVTLTTITTGGVLVLSEKAGLISKSPRSSLGEGPSSAGVSFGCAGDLFRRCQRPGVPRFQGVCAQRMCGSLHCSWWHSRSLGRCTASLPR